MADDRQNKIIDIIEGVLERAKRGDLTGVAIATTHSDLCTASAWAMEEATLAELLGSVAILNARLCQQAADEPDADPTYTGAAP